MHLTVAFLGSALAALALADAFQTVVVARHARRLPALTRRFYQVTWTPIAATSRYIRSEQHRERFLGLYASVNSFTQLVAKAKQGERVIKRWPPRAGDKPLL